MIKELIMEIRSARACSKDRKRIIVVNSKGFPAVLFIRRFCGGMEGLPAVRWAVFQPVVWLV